MVFQHIQRVFSETGHQHRRRGRANAFDRVPGKVFIDRFRRFRHGALHKVGFELLAMCRVRDPASRDGQHLARRGERNAADYRGLAAVVHIHPENGVAVFLVLIDDG